MTVVPFSDSPVHVQECFCGRECGFDMFRPRLGVFLWTGCGSVVCRPRLGAFVWAGVWVGYGPSTFWAVFVDGGVVQWCAFHRSTSP